MINTYSSFLFFAVLCAGAPTEEHARRQSRIIGGEVAADGAYPYIASVQSSYNFHMCGGSIIGSRTVMTGAQCLYGYTPLDVFVLVGSNQLNSGGTRYDAEKLLLHPDYNHWRISNDVGLVFLSRDIEMTPKVRIIPIGTKYIDGGTETTLSGWGTTIFPGITPNDLHVIKVRTIDQEECQRSLVEVGSVSNSSICTLTKKGEGACMGDAGSPLVFENSVIGIVSWGSPCANGLPDVSCRVSCFADWINENKI